MRKLILLLASGVFLGGAVRAQKCPSLAAFMDGIHHWNLEHKERNYARYEESDFRSIADNMIAYQNPDGGWPKNIDWLGILNPDSVYQSLRESYKRSTLDNRNTFPQIEYLADVYCETKETKYRDASLKGIDYLLACRSKSGGWSGWDVDAITFNDEVTTGALELFQKILQGDSSFRWLNAAYLKNIQNVYDEGIHLVLRCQVVQDGVKTAWAQQHDHQTLEPVGARTFELPSLTANESCPIIMMLMKIKDPAPEIIESVKNAVRWLEKVKLTGMRIERIKLNDKDIINHEYPYDNIVVEDTNAKPIWARFYEVKDNTPFLCTRQGIKVWKLSDVNPERRTGYDWYGYWPEEVLEYYPKWLKSIGD